MKIGNVKINELSEDSQKVFNEIKYCANKMGIDPFELVEALKIYTDIKDTEDR